MSVNVNMCVCLFGARARVTMTAPVYFEHFGRRHQIRTRAHFVQLPGALREHNYTGGATKRVHAPVVQQHTHTFVDASCGSGAAVHNAYVIIIIIIRCVFVTLLSVLGCFDVCLSV